MALSAIVQRFSRPFTSSSMRLSQDGPGVAVPLPEGAQVAIVAAGCFWGVEHMYLHDFASAIYKKNSKVGYIGGDVENPGYRAVCSGTTNHAEAYKIVFDPEKVSYRNLIEYFYKMHDPTTANQQGPDRGTQYRSGIFYENDDQKAIAEDVTTKANAQWYKGKIETKVLPAGKWWDAEDYHQQYLNNNPGGYECPSHFLRKFPPLQ